MHSLQLLEMARLHLNPATVSDTLSTVSPSPCTSSIQPTITRVTHAQQVWTVNHGAVGGSGGVAVTGLVGAFNLQVHSCLWLLL